MSSPPPTDPDRSGDFDSLVASADRDAQARDAAYARPDDGDVRPWALWALLVAMPVLALVVFWNVKVMQGQTLPPPAIEAVDLARTLRVAVDELETFVEDNGRLPTPAEAADFLPEEATFRPVDGSYELVIPAPVVNELRFARGEDPDQWLRSIRSTLDPDGAS
ncbi:hypothetical protein [Gaopeijia maritima]|uniref:Uncharacterized protein n=1 Tax=Gaopeijia maritima TaxID=3119007 RepID=A0ABU9EA20_9BACT